MSGQTPLWATFLVAGFAILASWGAQIIAAKKEAERAKTARQEEARAYWRDKRLEAYSSLLTHYEGMLDIAERATMKYHPSVARVRTEDFDKELSRHRALAEEVVGQVRMIGSSEVSHLSQSILTRLRYFELLHFVAPDSQEERQELIDRHREARKKVDELWTLTRKDLDVTR